MHRSRCPFHITGSLAWAREVCGVFSASTISLSGRVSSHQKIRWMGCPQSLTADRRPCMYCKMNIRTVLFWLSERCWNALICENFKVLL